LNPVAPKWGGQSEPGEGEKKKPRGEKIGVIVRKWHSRKKKDGESGTSKLLGRISVTPLDLSKKKIGKKREIDGEKED